MNKLLIGTSDWKYDSKKGILYPNVDNNNYLEKLSKLYNSVEVDQFLFGIIKSKDSKLISDYKASFPDNFQFLVRVPELITSTYYYDKEEKESLIENPYFLSKDLFKEFIQSLNPLQDQIAFLIFQFECFNNAKKLSSIEFLMKLYQFFTSLSYYVPPIAIEIKNPYYLNSSYFKMLKILNMTNVFFQDQLMPYIADIYDRYKIYIKSTTIISLQGSYINRIQKMPDNNWNKFYIDPDEELNGIIEMIKDLRNKGVKVYLNVNNGYDDCAQLTMIR